MIVPGQTPFEQALSLPFEQADWCWADWEAASFLVIGSVGRMGFVIGGLSGVDGDLFRREPGIDSCGGRRRVRAGKASASGHGEFRGVCQVGRGALPGRWGESRGMGPASGSVLFTGNTL